MSSAAEVAWFAGIFEGEGTIDTRKRSTVRIAIAMSDKDILERVNRLFPGSLLAKRNIAKGQPHHKEMWEWRVGTGQQVAEILTAILPWLGDRRRTRAIEALEWIAQRRVGTGLPRSDYCKNGHEMVGDNLMPRYGTKYRRCRACAKANWTRANRKRAAKSASLS